MKRILALFLLLGIAPGQSAYDAIHILDREIGFGSRALAMGGAYSGEANDYTAIYWNPAGLGLIVNREFSGELSHLNFNNQALYATRLTSNERTFTRLRSFGLAIPLATSRGSLVIAGGYNRIVDYDENLLFSGFSDQVNNLEFTLTNSEGISERYQFDRNVERYESMGSEGGLHQWNLGGAVALSKRVMTGLSVAYIRGEDQYRFQFIQTDTEDNYQSYPGDFDRYTVNRDLKSDLWALNLKLGGLIQVTRGIRLGGTLTLPSRFRIEETHSSDDELLFDDGYSDQESASGTWTYTVVTPYTLDGGVSISNRFLTLAMSSRIRDWTQTRFAVDKSEMKDAEYREFLAENEKIRQTYRPTTEIHLGGEIRLAIINTHLRGGYALIPSPLKDRLQDQDRRLITGGVSLIVDDHIQIETTYIHGTWDRDSRDEYTPGGTQETITLGKMLVGISYSW